VIGGRTGRVLWASWRATAAGAAEYRGDMLTGTLVSIVWLGVSSVPSVVVSLRAADAGGWGLPQLLYLLSIWYLMDAVMWIVIMPNIGQWPEQVRTGSLDAVLLKPVNSLIYCSLRVLGVQDLPKLLLAAGLAVTAVALGGGPPTPAAAVASVIAVLCGLVLLWALGVITSYKVLSQVQWDASFVLHAALNLGRVPTSLYGPLFRTVLTWVLPVAFITTVPAEVMFGMASPWMAVVALALTAVVVLIVVVLWRRELGRYTGAMS